MCQKNFGLVNVDSQPVADVINNIINKFSQAVGWMVTPHGSRKDMEVAVKTYIDEIQKDSSLPSIVKAAKISSASREIKEYINMQDILQHAREFGQAYEYVDQALDEDWTMYFYNMAKNVSRDDAKILWGKILAEECANKDSIPKKLVSTLAMMGKDDAELFKKVGMFSVIRDNLSRLPIIDFNDRTGLIKREGLNTSKLFNLEALGLITVSMVGFELAVEGENRFLPFSYHGKQGELQVQVGHRGVSQGNVSFTPIGEKLAELIETDELEVFWEYLKENGYIVSS